MNDDAQQVENTLKTEPTMSLGPDPMITPFFGEMQAARERVQITKLQIKCSAHSNWRYAHSADIDIHFQIVGISTVWMRVVSAKRKKSVVRDSTHVSFEKKKHFPYSAPASQYPNISLHWHSEFDE